jgi:DNA-binding response OmpR family regulator
VKILIAEDDPTARRVLEVLMRQRGYETRLACDGEEAWEILTQPDPPPLAILDWMMPECDGVTLCRRVRAAVPPMSLYIILLTANGRSEDIVTALDAGADDHVTKPFNREELLARIKVGERIIGLQNALVHRIRDLEDAASEIKTLQGLLPICSYCKRVRDDQNYWSQIEGYISRRSGAQFSHGICPDCYDRIVKPELERYAESVQGRV